MSQDDVEVVRRFSAPGDGEDMVPLIREAVERLGPDLGRGAVLARWAEHPALQHLHPDIEWDTRAMGLTVVRGPTELSLWLADWLEVWESYQRRALEYRDLGDWVLAPTEVHARGREGIAVEMRMFLLFQVREGKIVVCRAFLSEQEALEAVGARGVGDV